MGDTFMTVIMIMLVGILMFVFPVIELADDVDKVSQVDVQTMTSEFISKLRNTGRITDEDYSKFLVELNTDGNLYNVELEFKILDENPGKKSLQAEKDKIGENVYYSLFTTQIQKQLNSKGVYELKEGDVAIVTVRNVNTTFAQQIRDTFYAAVGSDIYTISTTQSAMIIANGSNVH